MVSGSGPPRRCRLPRRGRVPHQFTQRPGLVHAGFNRHPAVDLDV